MNGTTKTKSMIFNAGIPTEPDVKRLMDAFPNLKDGDKITYEAAAHIIGIESFRTSLRFRTVTARWRNLLYRNSNIYMTCIPNYGWQVADPFRRVQSSGAKFKSALRQTRRAGDLAIKTDVTGLDAEQQRIRDHVVSVAGAMQTVAATAAKRLRYPDPVLKLAK